ncbi:hypothetical protein C8Q80DRAFT_1147968 [Daedaleopsis nitida]|nr:hypothetical protein C8Q80DRAFT_1147968 [Daedaleopsis nitida]
MDPGDQCCLDCCGGCCLACTESLQMCCFTAPFGQRSSNHQAGCCQNCCKRSFDEDEFAPGQPAEEALSDQPAAQKPMSERPAGS